MKITVFFLGITVIAFLLLHSCKVSPNAKNPEMTLTRKVIVDRSEKGYYSIKFNKIGEWKIYTGPSVENIDWAKFSLVNGDMVHLPDQYPNQRMFFGIVGPNGDTTIASERLIPMEGQPNFRDLGGLETQDNRYVKWGSIYRSGKLSDLEKQDLRYMSHLGIKSVVDLRNDIEVAKDPDKYPRGVQYHQISLSDKEGKAYTKLRHMVMKEGYRRAKAKELFVGVMRSFADTLASDIKPVFDLLLSDKETTPLVYHCTGGKDRTGYTTAMILLALGVDRKTITNDYLMSNYYRKDANLKNMRRIRLTGLDVETIDYAILVRKEYMDAVFEVIDEKYDGPDNYFETKFGLTEEKRNELKRRYTEPYYNKKAEAIVPEGETAEENE